MGTSLKRTYRPDRKRISSWNISNLCPHGSTGLGKTTPDPAASITMDGVEVPLGTGISSGVSDTCLLYNEYPLRGSRAVRSEGRSGAVVTHVRLVDWRGGGACSGHRETVRSLTCVSSRYIVYDIAQVNLKYLLKLKFNFKTSLW